MQLTLFYDSQCPLCRQEIQALRQRDPLNRLRFEDLHATDLQQRYPDIDLPRAHAVLHGLTQDGRWLTGLDVTHAAWSLVGLGHLTAPLRWRPVRPFADLAYRLFARYRRPLGRWFAGNNGCDVCSRER
ncbi:DUF393 domain-containing protein [Marinobacter hydrocarbonoclasticus]|nr:DUF393 domain-containing protein [Marinobacter nauticus]